MKKSLMRVLSLALALVMLFAAAPVFTSSVYAEGEGTDPEEKDYVETDQFYLKKNFTPTSDDGSAGYLTLEAFAKGDNDIEKIPVAADIVLVLDASQSMTTNYVSVGEFNGSKAVLDELDKSHSSGYYYCVINGERHQMRYQSNGNKWQYYVQNGWTGSYTDFPTTIDNSFESIVISRWNALKNAVNEFLDIVKKTNDDLVDKYGVAHKVALVKFSGAYYGSGSWSGDRWDWNRTFTPNLLGTTSNYGGNNVSILIKNLDAVTAESINGFHTSVNDMDAGTYTAPDYGLNIAEAVLNQDGIVDDGRPKIVIMFTDGAPNHDIATTTGYQESVANDAIEIANRLKNNTAYEYAVSNTSKEHGAKIYTIGILDGVDPNHAEEVEEYMHFVSSNYPNAMKLGDKPTQASDKYYTKATTASGLTDIFTDIAQAIPSGGSFYNFNNQKPVVADTVSFYFDIPEDKVSEITVSTADFNGKDAAGNYTWKSAVTMQDPGLTIADKSVKVNNFDMGANWVGFDATMNEAPHGKKLIITIPIEKSDSGEYADYYGAIPTNTDKSGIYLGDEMIAAFPVPTAECPFEYTVTHSSGAEDTVFSVAGSAEPTKVATKLNLTTMVADGYLYGGICVAGSDGKVDWNSPQTDVNGETGLSITAYNGAHFYIREVSDSYLQPKTLNTWHHENGEPVIARLFNLTAVDSVNYQYVGFNVGSGDTSVFGDASVNSGNAPSYTGSGSILYQNLQTVNASTGADLTNYTMSNVFGSLTGYMGVYEVTDSYNLKSDDCSFTFTPFWVTKDSVKVTGIYTRTVDVSGRTDPTHPTVTNEKVGSTCTKYVGNVANRAPIDVQNTYISKADTMTVQAGSFRVGGVAETTEQPDFETFSVLVEDPAIEVMPEIAEVPVEQIPVIEEEAPAFEETEAETWLEETAYDEEEPVLIIYYVEEEPVVAEEPEVTVIIVPEEPEVPQPVRTPVLKATISKGQKAVKVTAFCSIDLVK